jgi:DNA-binding MarR family transcriptional regulator
MENKRLGLIIIGISIVFSLLAYGLGNQLSEFQIDSCTCTDTCEEHDPPYMIYGLIAVIFSTLSLGVYLLFFEKSHSILVKKLQEDSSVKSNEERFNLILMGLNEDEKKILTAVKDQDGITQHTLGLRTNLHKSKLSIITGILEEKGLIKKEKKGKTNQLFLRVNLEA